MDSVWTILVASLAAINCSLIGTYLVLRKMAMIGDAIAHSFLPGIVIAFFLTGSRTSWVVLFGAGVMGILATLLMEFLHSKVKLQSDAAIGINFTWLLALGIILISFLGKKIDLDPDCILYGEIAYVPLDTWVNMGGIGLGPRSFYVLASVLLVNLGLVLIGYKELSISTFDPIFSTAIGVHTTAWHYVLMGATSFTTVAAFEQVGVVLIVALLVAPPATAYLLTKRLPSMLVVASLIGVLASVGGYYLAVGVNGSIAGSMAALAGSCFLVVFSMQKRALCRRLRL